MPFQSIGLQKIKGGGKFFLKEQPRDGCAGLGVGEGVVVGEVAEAAGGGHGVELVVGQMGQATTRGGEGVEEDVVGVVHLIDLEGGAQAAFVEAGVVGHERQPFDERRNAGPNVGEDGSAVGVGARKAVRPDAPIRVVVGFGANERIKTIDHLSAAHDDHAHAASAAGLIVGRLEIYGCEVVHLNCSLA